MRDVTTKSGPSGDEDKRAAGRARGARGPKGAVWRLGSSSVDEEQPSGPFGHHSNFAHPHLLFLQADVDTDTHALLRLNLGSVQPTMMLKRDPHSVLAVSMVTRQEAERRGQESSSGSHFTKKDAAAKRRALAPLLGARFGFVAPLFPNFWRLERASKRCQSIYARRGSHFEPLAASILGRVPHFSLLLLNARCTPDAVPDPHSLHPPRTAMTGIATTDDCLETGRSWSGASRGARAFRRCRPPCPTP